MAWFLAAKAFAGRIPRQVWIGLGAALLLLGLVIWHQRHAHNALEAAYNRGTADEGARIAKKAIDLKARIDALSGKISIALKGRNNEENRIIAGRADDLRLRGPGKAACPGVAGVPSGAGGSVTASGRPDAPATGLPDQDRIALPFDWTVSQAETCDLNRAEALTWREWWKQQSEAWAKAAKP